MARPLKYGFNSIKLEAFANQRYQYFEFIKANEMKTNKKESFKDLYLPEVEEQKCITIMSKL